MVTIVLDLLALSCALATVFYIRSARHRQRFLRLIEGDPGTHPEALTLAEASFRKEVHGAVVYGLLVVVALLVGRVDVANITVVLALLAVPRGDVGVVGPNRRARGPHGPQTGMRWSAGPSRPSSRSSLRPRRGRPGWRPRRCPTSAGSRSAGSTRRDRV